MEYVDGVHLDEFMKSGPSQEVRDRFGQRIALATFRLRYDKHLLYADPQPGNYFFMRLDAHLELTLPGTSACRPSTQISRFKFYRAGISSGTRKPPGVSRILPTSRPWNATPTSWRLSTSPDATGSGSSDLDHKNKLAFARYGRDLPATRCWKVQTLRFKSLVEMRSIGLESEGQCVPIEATAGDLHFHSRWLDPHDQIASVMRGKRLPCGPEASVLVHVPRPASERIGTRVIGRHVLDGLSWMALEPEFWNSRKNRSAGLNQCRTRCGETEETQSQCQRNISKRHDILLWVHILPIS